MSSTAEGKLRHADALALAREIAQELEPIVVRAKAAGSLRRMRPHVGDIEFVIEPRTVEGDLFGTMGPDVATLQQLAARLGDVVKCGEKMIQIAHVLGSTVACEFYICTPPAQWGSILAIRTGPWQLGRYCMGRMYDFGRKHVDGYVKELRGGAVFPTPDEADFFRAAGLVCVAPKLRDTQAAYQPLREAIAR